MASETAVGTLGEDGESLERVGLSAEKQWDNCGAGGSARAARGGGRWWGGALTWWPP
jgi:hypothetical protein